MKKSSTGTNREPVEQAAELLKVSPAQIRTARAIEQRADSHSSRQAAYTIPPLGKCQLWGRCF